MQKKTASELLAGAKAILFDMDGVLIDSEPMHERSLAVLSAELGGGEPLGKEMLNSFKGVPEPAMAGRLEELYPAHRGRGEQIIERRLALYAEMFHQVGLLPGVLDFLKQSKERGLRVALTTSAARTEQELTFRTHGLGPWFEAVVTGADITRGKPDPEPYLLTAAKLGLYPAECVVIEDSVNGVKSGLAAGCKVIAITGSFPRSVLEALGPDAVIEGYGEVLG